MLSRSLVRARRKVLVAATSAPALGNDDRLVRPRKIVNQLTRLVVIQQSAYRNLERRMLPGLSRTIRSQPMGAALCLVLRIEPKVDQRVVAQRRRHKDASPMPPVPPRRAALRHKLLPPEGHATVATVAGLDPNSRFVNKHFSISSGLGWGVECTDAHNSELT